MARKLPPKNPEHDRGQRLYDDICEAHELTPDQKVILEEAARCADRLDQLDDIIAGKGVLQLLHFRHMTDRDDQDRRYIEMTVDGVLAEARQQQNILKQLLVSLRLPDVQGQRAQHRGARGAYAKGAKDDLDSIRANVTSIGKARKRA